MVRRNHTSISFDSELPFTCYWLVNECAATTIVGVLFIGLALNASKVHLWNFISFKGISEVLTLESHLTLIHIPILLQYKSIGIRVLELAVFVGANCLDTIYSYKDWRLLVVISEELYMHWIDEDRFTVPVLDRSGGLDIFSTCVIFGHLDGTLW